jgi:hypothetical protein
MADSEEEKQNLIFVVFSLIRSNIPCTAVFKTCCKPRD